jgi:phosphomannomutase
VVDVRYIFTLRKIVEENGGELVVSRVGHAFITEKLSETGAIFGGESSGHYFFRSTGNAESPLTVLFIVLKVMTEESKKLSEIVKELRRSYESGEFGELNFKVSNTDEVIESIKEKYKDGALTSIDCVEIEYPDWRLTVRTSNTEPLLRLSIEAYDKNIMEDKRDELVSLVESVGHTEV